MATADTCSFRRRAATSSSPASWAVRSRRLSISARSAVRVLMAVAAAARLCSTLRLSAWSRLSASALATRSSWASLSRRWCSPSRVSVRRAIDATALVVRAKSRTFSPPAAAGRCPPGRACRARRGERSSPATVRPAATRSLPAARQPWPWPPSLRRRRQPPAGPARPAGPVRFPVCGARPAGFEILGQSLGFRLERGRPVLWKGWRARRKGRGRLLLSVQRRCEPDRASDDDGHGNGCRCHRHTRRLCQRGQPVRCDVACLLHAGRRLV